ncbi:mechanosensitive ion channel family protein [Chitiniphilus purpureus]|uniref:Mechanosensitive ion channel family protein n=1 Tax=Chitiniphilus purpureus TaxID=2981137 RepID=A0ABY6DMW5_9NEIS|nr:mechanosensitive ion channel family protein [Chitiniphilus sp. CD1]UXY15347.1 mechanosensitive ion channel family protein [Chitiniphilus sp. CD1]
MLRQILRANNQHDLLVALAITVATLLAIYLLRAVLTRYVAPRLQARSSVLAQAWAASFSATRFWLLLPIALKVGSNGLTLPGKVDSTLSIVALIAFILQLALWLNRGLVAWFNAETERRRSLDAEAATAMTVLGFIARVVLWSMILLIVLDQLGFNISGLVAGLGIGGVAVALAVQNILGDLFASLAIVLDKPFVVGDFIIVGDMMGNIERVGLKTTRVRSLSGEQLVFSNDDLLKSRIRNYQKLRERRVVFSVAVPYDTPRDKLERIPGMLRDIIGARDKVRLDRAHFQGIGNAAFTFEVVYFVLDPDFNLYMDIQQQINLELVSAFEREDIEFATPIQRLRYAGGDLMQPPQPQPEQPAGNSGEGRG